MAELPNGDHNSGDHYFNNYGTQGFSSTMPMDNLFDFPENIDMSELFDLLEHQPPTNNAPSSLIENVVPNHQNPIEIGAPSDHQNTLEVQDDYSLSHIFSMGTNNVVLLQEEGGEITSNGDGIEQENPSTNAIILQQPMPKTPILEEQENPSTNAMILQQPMPTILILEEQQSPKTNDSITNQSMPKEPISEEQEKPKTNGLILQQPMPTIPCLLKAKERNFMNSKYTSDYPFGTSTRREQETPKTNDMILNPPMTTIPVSEKKESDFLRPKMTNIQPFKINSWKEKQTPKTNNLILNTTFPRLPTLEKKKSEHMKSKLISTNTPYGISNCNLLGIGTGKTTWNAYLGTRTTHKDDESRYGVLNSFDNHLQVALPQKTISSSSSGGPIRRSSNQTSSRYQPFGRQISNNQGSNSSEPTFNRSQATDGSVVCDIGKLWKHQRREIKRKTGLASYYTGSSNIHRQIWNNLQKRSLSPQVAEIEKRNSNGPDLIGETSSKKDNHSMLQNLANQNFQNSPAIIANEINSSIAGGQSMTNQSTGYYPTENSQSWGYAQGISLGNEYGAQLQQGGYYAMETGNEIMDAQYSGFQTTGNDQIMYLQSSGFQAMGNEITDVQYSGVQATGNEITGVQYSGVQARGNGIMDVQYSGFQAVKNGITEVQYSGVQATGNDQITHLQSSGFQAMGNEITDVQHSGFQALGNEITDVQYSGVEAMGNEITGLQYSGVQATGNGLMDVQYSGFQAAEHGITEVQYSGFQATGNEIMNMQYSGVQATGNEIMEVQYSGYAQGISGSQSFNPEETQFDVTNWQFGDESQGNI